jgi:hypothetical protein
MKTTTLCLIALALISPILAQTATVPDRFKQFDTNGDGKLTREEVPSAESFRAADANKDGAVTPEEFVRYLAARRRTPGTSPALAPKPAAATPAPVDGKPVLKSLPDSDAVRDAAGTGQLFECVHVPGLTDIQKGVNGFAIADLNRDGRPDFIATVSPPVSLPGVVGRRPRAMCSAVRRLTAIDQLLVVLLNEGGFRFREHRIEIRGSTLTPEQLRQPRPGAESGGLQRRRLPRPLHHAPLASAARDENRGNLPLLGNTFLSAMARGTASWMCRRRWAPATSAPTTASPPSAT